MVKDSIPRRLVRRVLRMRATRSNAAIFGNIYEKRLWGVGADPSVPFYSRIGSYDTSVKQFVALVVDVVQNYDIKKLSRFGVETLLSLRNMWISARTI
jgi:hypothetical protein